VAEVGVAVLRAHLGAAHEELAVRASDDVLGFERLPEGGPAGAGLVLVLRAEEGLAADHVDVDPCLVVVPVLVAEGGLGALVLGHLVLHVGQPLAQDVVARLRVLAVGVGALPVHGLLLLGGGGDRGDGRADAGQQGQHDHGRRGQGSSLGGVWHGLVLSGRLGRARQVYAPSRWAD
jgi:hypothetical protein